jgi:uncharacterized protein (UPF0335 family)
VSDTVIGSPAYLRALQRARRHLDATAPPKKGNPMNGHDKLLLVGMVQELQELDERRRELSQQKSEIMRNAVDRGFSRAALREVLRRMKMDAADREDHEHLVDEYMLALGMTPLELEIERDRQAAEATVRVEAAVEEHAPKPPVASRSRRKPDTEPVAASSLN